METIRQCYTNQLASLIRAHTCCIATFKLTRVVFFLLSSDDSYISLASWRRWVCCCKLSKSSNPGSTRKGRQNMFYWALYWHREGTLGRVNVSHLLRCRKSLPKVFFSLLLTTHTLFIQHRCGYVFMKWYLSSITGCHNHIIIIMAVISHLVTIQIYSRGYDVNIFNTCYVAL